MWLNVFSTEEILTNGKVLLIKMLLNKNLWLLYTSGVYLTLSVEMEKNISEKCLFS